MNSNISNNNLNREILRAVQNGIRNSNGRNFKIFASIGTAGIVLVTVSFAGFAYLGLRDA